MRYKAIWLFVLSLFSLSLSSQAPAQTQPAYQSIGSQQYYSKGPWIGWNAPWSCYGNTHCGKAGVDYQDTTSIATASFPSQSQIKWYYPNHFPTNGGVWNYDALSLCKYDGGVPQNTSTCIPRQAASLTKFDVSSNLSWATTIGDFNLLTEMFLWKDAGFSAKTQEIGFFQHAAPSTITYVKSGRQIGVFTDRFGTVWQVAEQPGPAGPYYMFMLPNGANLTNGTVDFAGALVFLKNKTEITGQEWVSGAALGVEVVSGSGIVFVNALSAVVQ